MFLYCTKGKNKKVFWYWRNICSTCFFFGVFLLIRSILYLTLTIWLLALFSNSPLFLQRLSPCFPNPSHILPFSCLSKHIRAFYQLCCSHVLFFYPSNPSLLRLFLHWLCNICIFSILPLESSWNTSSQNLKMNYCRPASQVPQPTGSANLFSIYQPAWL